MDAVVVKDLVKRYDEFEALKGLDLSVRQGEIFGVLGPNGAGKTTLINVLTTMQRPTSGEAWVGGHSVLRDPDGVRRSLGVVFQHQTLDTVLSAEENLRIHGRLYKMDRAELERSIPELLEIAGLTDRAKDRVSTFSGGMRRRLEIVRSIIHKPRVLLLDEPTVALDPQSRATIWDYITRIGREYNITILLTTHYMEEADRLCDRIAIVDGGKLVALDTPVALKHALGGDRLELRVAGGDGARALAGIRALPHVIGAEAEAGNSSITVRLREPAVTIPSVLRTVADAKLEVVSMDHHPSSMDDVFLHRTGRATRDKRKKRRQGRIWSFFTGARG